MAAATHPQATEQGKMEAWGTGAFVKAALDYCDLRWALHFQPQLLNLLVHPPWAQLFLLIAISVQSLQRPLEGGGRGEQLLCSFLTKELGFAYLRNRGPWRPPPVCPLDLLCLC